MADDANTLGINLRQRLQQIDPPNVVPRRFLVTAMGRAIIPLGQAFGGQFVGQGVLLLLFVISNSHQKYYL